MDDAWDVVQVDLSLEEKKSKSAWSMLPRAASAGMRRQWAHAPERKWRHLDTMQFETILIAKTPRIQCPKCGIKTITVPWAEKYFRKWYGWAARSRLKPMVSAAKTLNRHLANLLSYFRHRITNTNSEGFNSRIQSIKSNARGFRCFENYRTQILFYCGKLNVLPEGITH